jgi:hypothetical protein
MIIKSARGLSEDAASDALPACIAEDRKYFRKDWHVVKNRAILLGSARNELNV